MNRATTIKLLEELEKAYPSKKKVHVFCDNARYYRSKEVQAYLVGTKLTLHHLPPYSPNLNPIERLWKWMRNRYYEQHRGFKEALLSFFSELLKAQATSELGICFRSRVRDKLRAIQSPLTTFGVT
ncbi:MAG: transposase [Candidatus Amoebophilus sp.]